MVNAQLFYKDNANIIYSISNNETERYFLAVPVIQYNNFMTFMKLKVEDNTKKGTSEYSDEKLKRKNFLGELIKVNEFIRNLNTNLVYSRVNHLKELPIKELEDVLNENKPFDMNRYKEITKNIEMIINEDFRLMTSSNIKKESVEQTILLISQKENDKEFINWLKVKLSSDYSQKNLEELRLEYKKENINLNIEDYKQINKDGKKYLIGQNSNKEMFTVEIPQQYDILQVFQLELKTFDKSKLVGLDGKAVATILFNKIIMDLPSQRMENIINKTTESEKNEENMLEKKTSNDDNDYIVDTKNNIALNTTEDKVLTYDKTPTQELVMNEAEVYNYNYNQNTNQPNETETLVQNKGKRLILAPSNRIPEQKNAAFIKISTIFLFGLSFLLTIISLVLLIIS